MANWVALWVVLVALATPLVVVGVTIPVPWDQRTNYGDFVKRFTFAVGDILEFTYGPTHSVSEVTEPNYDSCTGTSPINHYSSGNDKVTLSTAGDYYFICPTPGHCENGMKIKVTVVAATPTPPTSQSPPPPVTTDSPPPQPATKSPPPSQSATYPPPPSPATTQAPKTAASPPPSGNGASVIKISNFAVGTSLVVATAMGILW